MNWATLLPLIISAIEAAPQLVGAIEKLIAAFKSGGADAARAALLEPELQNAMAAADQALQTPIQKR